MTRKRTTATRKQNTDFTQTRAFRKLVVLATMGMIVALSLVVIYHLGNFVVSSFAEEVVQVEEPEEETVTVATPKRSKEVCSCTNHSVKFKRDHYDRHRAHAKRLNNHEILTENRIHTSKDLVKVKPGKGFVIDNHKLTHSYAYLNRRAYLVLLEMGNAYAEQVKDTKAEGSVFHISSLSRTTEQQKKLVRTAGGRNATRKESAHSYGASFDIWKLENTENCHVARKAFEKVLKDFQKSGKVLLCPEGNCIHVTVKR